VSVIGHRVLRARAIWFVGTPVRCGSSRARGLVSSWFSVDFSSGFLANAACVLVLFPLLPALLGLVAADDG